MKITLQDFKIGQTAYIELTGNMKRGKQGEDLIRECTVEAVGRKYVTANGIQFMETDSNYYTGLIEKTNCCVNFVLYPTRELLMDKMLRESLINKLNYNTDFSKLPLEQLKTIYNILYWKEHLQDTAESIADILQHSGFNNPADSSGYFIINEFPCVGKDRAVDVYKSDADGTEPPHYVVYCSYEDGNGDFRNTTELTVESLLEVLVELHEEEYQE